MFYRLLKKNEENDRHRHLAQQALQKAADELGISPNTPIGFFVEGRYGDAPEALFEIDTCGGKNLHGFAQHGEIFLRAGLSYKAIRGVVRHESKHVCQYFHWEIWGERSAEVRERDAVLFELAEW
jgi:hypothetical protein